MGAAVFLVVISQKFAPRCAVSRASVVCRSNNTVSDPANADIAASLRDEYAEWIARDPERREPMFWEQVERASERRAELRRRKQALVEQLLPLREILRTLQAASGVELVAADDEHVTGIMPLGWALTVAAAIAPVAALQGASASGQRALATLLQTEKR
ncbi:hypothetical protein KFE25_008069 [Diacronema lutheri]|uniref:Uncharacterized protein n=1 Tax=Diacronema lutheri TaxID=2081491 RepID=A0A8J5XWD7_DIALT|nr:hypothetical protein KFE25_008069 [Diacronema lutheri]